MASADRTDARRGRQTPLGGRPERLLAAAVCFLVCFGLVMVYSASSARAFLQAGDPLGLLKRQAVYALLGLGVYCLCARIQPATLCLGVLGMLLVAGARLRHLVTTAAVALAFTSIAIALEPYRRDRLLAFLHPWHDAGSTGYQIVQAQIALGSGGIFGKGLGQG